ncbi:MAG TPA: hypothetical protein VFN23_11120 [Ktedonobacteraceae bacterium]|nr:hypothetical protein [Ktedonobacteraceae bacterium]
MNAPIQQEKWRKWINRTAAMLFAIILVGSLIMQLAHPNNLTSQSQPASTILVHQKISIQELEVSNTVISKHDWQVIATFHGVGEQTLNAKKLKLPKIWATYLSCQGSGQALVEIQQIPNEATDTIFCSHSIAGKKYLSLQPYFGYTNTLHVNTGNRVHWQLQIMGCGSSASACGLKTEPPVGTQARNAGTHQGTRQALFTPTVKVVTPPLRTPTPRVKHHKVVTIQTIVPDNYG